MSRAGLPDGRTGLLGIVGDPIAHSLSPRLHTEVLRRLDRNLIYLPFPVSAGRLRRFVREAWSFGVLGLNVTTPYKERVARWVRPGGAETRRAGVVNTVFYRGRSAGGCGTDGAGILSFLRACGLDGEPFGILGFGATARSLAARALAEGTPPACVVTRRAAAVRGVLRRWGVAVPVLAAGESRAGKVVRAGRRRGVERRRSGGGAPLAAPPPRLWVSTLPPSAAVPAWLFSAAGSRSSLLDLNYGEGRIDLVDRARAAGWRACDGLGPLCHQAALSLGIWLGEEVPVALFLRALGRTERSLRPAR